MRRAILSGVILLTAFVGFGGTRLASGHYGSSYTYYLKDDDNNRAYVTSSGYWNGWTSNNFWFESVSGRIDVNIYSSSSVMEGKLSLTCTCPGPRSQVRSLSRLSLGRRSSPARGKQSLSR